MNVKPVFLALVLFVGWTPLSAEEIRISTQSLTGVGNEISLRIMTEAYRRLGHTLVLEEFPLERSLQAANEGQVDGELYRQDGMTSLYPNLRQVPVMLVSGDLVVFTKTRRFPVKGWASLLPYSLGYLRGQKSVELHLPAGAKAQSFLTLEQAFKMLDTGRLEIVVATILQGTVVLRNQGYDSITFLSPPLQLVPVYHYLNVKREALLAPLTAALKQMDAEGMLAKIRQDVIAEYLPTPKGN